MSKRLIYSLIIFVGIVLILTVSVLATLMMKKAQDDNTVSDLVTIESNLKDIGDFSQIEESQIKVDHVTINGSGEYLYLKNGLIKASPLLCNYNTNYLMRVTILRGDKQLYRSGLIPSGKAVSDLPLSEKLSAGNHDVKMVYEFYANINEKISTKVDVSTKIVVEK